MVGLSTGGCFACLCRVNDCVTGLDLMADFATATVDGIVTASGKYKPFFHIDLDVDKDETEESSASDSSESNKEGEPSTL